MDNMSTCVRNSPYDTFKGPPEQTSKLMVIEVVMPSVRVHVAQCIFKALQDGAERQDLGISPVDDSVYVACIWIHKDVHLTEVVMSQDERVILSKE